MADSAWVSHGKARIMVITTVTMMSRMRPTSRRHHSASTAPSGSTSVRGATQPWE